MLNMYFRIKKELFLSERFSNFLEVQKWNPVISTALRFFGFGQKLKFTSALFFQNSIYLFAHAATVLFLFRNFEQMDLYSLP